MCRRWKVEAAGNEAVLEGMMWVMSTLEVEHPPPAKSNLALVLHCEMRLFCFFLYSDRSTHSSLRLMFF